MTTITEEATETVRVKIKPLDWTKIEDVYSADGGEIQITQWWQRGQIVAFEYNDIEFASFDEAKAAAQADYEARIRSALVATDDATRCIACDQALKAGELVLDDASGGIIHRECCGPEREAYTGEDGGPLKDGEPIPTGWAWEPDPRPSAPQAEGRDTGLREAVSNARDLIGAKNDRLSPAVREANINAAWHVLTRALSPKEPE